MLQRLLIAFVPLLLLSACASTPQTKALLSSRLDGAPRHAHISGVPFVRQTENYCGPASVAMILAWAGQPATLERLGSQMYTPGKAGTLQTDVITVARRHGLLALRVANLKDILKEIAAGNPVLVFQNLGFSWYRQWHYAVAVGYDLDEAELVLHSGQTASDKVSLHSFERTWTLAGDWAVVLLPPGRLSATADEYSHLEAAAALEQLERSSAASRAYKRILEKWPTSLGALLGQGNARFALKDYKGAMQSLHEATLLSPGLAPAWHNLAFAYLALKNSTQAKAAARRAIQLVDAPQAQAYRESLTPLLGGI